MEKTYAHWRAAHPLLFISAHLCIGVLFAEIVFSTNRGTSLIVPILILLSTLLLLGILFNFCHAPAPINFVISAALISWGVAIFFATSTQDLLHMPFPSNFINYCRTLVIEKINRTIHQQEANGFAQALLLGVKTDINKTLLKAYNQLGIIHIIAISGMHLEIIFKNLTRITNWLPRKKYFLVVELFIIIGGIWTYTLMAFASPSIVRASVFFSIYFIGKFLKQSALVLNIIAGGILVVLLFDVKNLHNIGLQLSYAAVIGIHLFYPLLFKMLPMDNPILSFFWSNFCVTLAAQLTTLPILAYHFHQLSTLVLVSNFIMVPLSNVLLYALALLICLPNFYNVALVFGNYIESYILRMNGVISLLYTKSISKVAIVNFSAFDVSIYYLLLLFVYLWLFQKKSRFLLYSIWVLGFLFAIKLFSPVYYLWKI